MLLATLNWALFSTHLFLWQVARTAGIGWLIGWSAGEVVTRWFSG